MTNGERIKYLREKNGFTQKDIATRLGVEPAAISKYELDMREPNIKIVKQLAMIFNVTTDYLLGIESTVEEFPTIEDFIEKYKENNELYFNLYIEITNGNHEKARKLYDECIKRKIINKENSSCSTYENFINNGYGNYFSNYRMFCDDIFKKEHNGGYSYAIQKIIADSKTKEKYIKFLKKQKDKKMKDIENLKIEDYDEDFKQFKENMKNIYLLEKELNGKINLLKRKNAQIEHKYHEYTTNSYKEQIFEKYFIERIKNNEDYIQRNYKKIRI